MTNRNDAGDPLPTHPVSPDLPLIKVVGISASGKSTLVKALRQRGYHARPVSQEHSNVADLWQQFERPRLLIYLDVDLATQEQRRPDVTWDKQWLQEETARLEHARGHANLMINTAGQSAEQVFQIALTYLQQEAIRHADEPLPPLAATGSALQPKQAQAAVAVDEELEETGKQRSNRTQRRINSRRDKRNQKRKMENDQ